MSWCMVKSSHLIHRRFQYAKRCRMKLRRVVPRGAVQWSGLISLSKGDSYIGPIQISTRNHQFFYVSSSTKRSAYQGIAQLFTSLFFFAERKRSLQFFIIPLFSLGKQWSMLCYSSVIHDHRKVGRFFRVKLWVRDGQIPISSVQWR